MNNFNRLLGHLSGYRIKQLALLLFLMIVASILEIVSLGAVLPFLGVLTAPEQIFHHAYMQPLVAFLKLSEPSQLILPVTIIFIIAVLIAGIVRLLLLYVMIRLSYAIGADISINIYRRTLYQEYSVHIGRNSSEVINSIIVKANVVVSHILTPVLVLISSLMMLIGITIVLFTIDIGIALLIFTSFGLLYWLIVHYTKELLKNNSRIIADQSTQIVKALQEGLGGIRDILVDGAQKYYCQLYRDSDLPLRRASGNNQFISGAPRYIMEAIGMIFIAGLAYILTLREGGIMTAIPILGVVALGAQKLLPVLQQAYNSYSTIKGSKASFKDVLDLLDQSLPDYVDRPNPKPIQFKKEIELNNLGFCYEQESSWVLKGINLTLKKGSRIGFIGSTGSGKSTLIDIIMGLLPATEGGLLIDQQLIDSKNRRAWQAHISHVPQNIYLSDGSIEENIAFGIEKNKINHQRVRKAAQQAQISGLIEQWKDGYKTFIGEQGVRLSGGQRQRIGIARALYKQSNILIFDEATSALDSETELAVMKAIEELDSEVTILIIAHRLSTLKTCDVIIKLDGKGVISKVKYKDIINLNEKPKE
jgi:ATP-binding cassette, subfamily B, bacterial PglK